MALVDNAWYVNFGDGSTTGYYAAAMWTALTTYNAGNIVRQRTTPAVGSERCFVAIVGNVASLAAEPAAWTITRGGKTAEAASVTWQECTGIAALNGDATNTPTWTTVKNTAITLGQVIKNVAGTIYLICSTAGAAGNGSEPSWATYTNAGATTADNTVTWTNIGVVGNFTGWQVPHARLANCWTTNWAQAGNKVFIADNHAETQSTAMILTTPGIGSAVSIDVYCVDHTVAVPPATLATTASIATTGNAAISIAGTASFNGIKFKGGDGANAGGITLLGTTNALYTMRYDNCVFQLLGTAGTGLVNVTNAGGSHTLLLNNCSVRFGATSGHLRVNNACNVKWVNSPSAIDAAGSAPTTLFDIAGGNITLDGVDLSFLGSGCTLFGSNNSGIASDIRVRRCRVGASVTLAATPTSRPISFKFMECDSAGTNYLNAIYAFDGTQTVETSIIRTGGATDGTTPISWKIATNSSSAWLTPFESDPIAIWNGSTAAITTLTFYGTTTGGGVPNNDDIWVEAEYLGSGSAPLGSLITSTKANNLAAAAATNNSSDGSTWGGSGAGNGFKIVVPSFAPGMKGPINLVIKVAKASATYYIDPQPEIAGIPVWRSYALAPGVYASERMIGRGGLHPIDAGLSA